MRLECGISGECREYRFVVPEGGGFLRIGIDVELDDQVRDGVETTNKTMRYRIFDPRGMEVDPVTGLLCTGSYSGESAAYTKPYSEESQIERAIMPGRWSVVVIPAMVEGLSYRMRASLQARKPDPADPSAPAFPNLRMIPPLEFTFTAPATPVGPGADAAGTRPLSCTPLDAPDTGADSLEACLRFSAGPENTGPGPVDLRGHPGPEDITVDLEDGSARYETPAYQVTYRADRTVLEARRPAGTFRWHEAHTHWHFQGYLTYELLRVDRKGKRVDLAESEEGRKVGSCPGDERLADWERTQFFQDTRGDAIGRQRATGFDGSASCGLVLGSYVSDPSKAGSSLSSGWGDIYEWTRPEQFVAMPTSGDGRPQDGQYVLRATTDSDNYILESDETDNVSYALIEVKEGSVRLLERGYGSDPWDEEKQVEWPEPPPCQHKNPKKCS